MSSPGNADPGDGGICSESPDATQRVWGYVATDVSQPRPCIEKCQDLFAKRLVPTFDGTDMPQICEALSHNVSTLRELYCCDSLLCGVHIDRAPGQDPNVNFIINQCQKTEFGGYLIDDPGPPETDSVCPLDTISRDQQGFPCRMLPHIVGEILPNPSIDAETMTALTFDTESQPTVAWTPNASSAHPSPAHTAKIPQTSEQGATRPDRFALGATAAVAICTILVFMALVGAALCCFHHKRSKGYRAPAGTRCRIKHHVVPPRSPPSPPISLVGSANGPPYTFLSPPARLSERRLLSPIIGAAGKTSTTGLLIPITPPPPVYGDFQKPPVCNHALSVQPSSPELLSPARHGMKSSPLRPHDSGPELPDHVRSEWAGRHIQLPSPPPNRALPPTPVASASFSSQSFQLATQR